MKITKPILKDLIRQVYEEAYQDLCCDPLIAEPEGLELPPEVISEELTGNQRAKIFKLLDSLSSEERASVFAKFGYYTSRNLLKQLNAIKRAEKGDL